MTAMEASQHTTQHTLQELRSQVAALTDQLSTAEQESAIHKAQWSERVEQYNQQIDELYNEVSIRRAENEELESVMKLIAGHTHSHTLTHTPPDSITHPLVLPLILF